MSEQVTETTDVQAMLTEHLITTLKSANSIAKVMPEKLQGKFLRDYDELLANYNLVELIDGQKYYTILYTGTVLERLINGLYPSEN